MTKLKMFRAILRNSGFRPTLFLRAVRNARLFVRQREAIKKAADNAGWRWGPELPMLLERDEPSGSLGAYFLQDQLVARWVYGDHPVRHVDVGSRIDGFVGSVSVFREIEVIDIRPAPGEVKNICFHKLNLMEHLPETWVSCTDSLSCLHTIEHFGLGRYGDPLDLNGHEKGLTQLKRMVKPGGRIYLSTPMGPQRIEFNAHRVFSAQTILSWFAQGWMIERFACIDDSGCLHEEMDWHHPGAANHFGCNTGVAILSAIRNAP